MTAEVYCATVLYPFAPGLDFDADRYAREIAPRYAQLLGDNCLGFEVREGQTSPGRPHPDNVCIASFWVRSAEAFGASLGSAPMKALMAEIDAFSSIRPIRQFDVCRVARYPGQGGDMPRPAPRKMLEALADPTRSQIFEILGRGPKAVGELAKELPISRPAVSYHLAMLHEAGLIAVRHEGTRHIHAIDPRGLGELRAWFAGFWSANLEDLKEDIEGGTRR